MRNVLFYIFLTGFIVLAGVFSVRPLFSPCDSPFHYYVGSVDPKFNLTRQDFITDVGQAGDIWSQAEGKTLFVYDPNVKFSVNLVYDERQALNNQVNSLNTQVNSEKNTIDPEIAKYDQMTADFQKKVTSLNAEIDYWNGKGGAPTGEYDKLLQEQSDLKNESEQLNTMARSLNQSTQTYNYQVGQLNKTINVYDQTIHNKPEEGLYQPALNKIDIYYNNGHTELVHTLTHELGHALGMNHVQDPHAIMYYQTNEYTTPTPADLTELERVCQKRSIYELLQERVVNIIQFYTSKQNS